MLIEIANKMTLQQLVDYIADKLLLQGQQSLKRLPERTVKVCAYGNGKGQHCAIGWILDTTNTELMASEGTPTSLLSDSPECLPELVKENIDLFGRIQTFHDLGASYLIDTESLKNRLAIMRDLYKHVNFNENWDKLCLPENFKRFSK